MSGAVTRQARKQRDRAEREAQLAERILASHVPSDKRYGLILADPPWQFSPYSLVTGMDRAADNHYPTMPTHEICALPIPAADDALLFLWATSPMLQHALAVMTNWGFVYKSQMIWNKCRRGTGYWFINQHEILLLGKRGSPVAPRPGSQALSILEAPRGRHSAKPEAVYEMIEQHWPNTPKVEFFSRRRRQGWDVLYSPEAYGQERIGDERG